MQQHAATMRSLGLARVAQSERPLWLPHFSCTFPPPATLATASCHFPHFLCVLCECCRALSRFQSHMNSKCNLSWLPTRTRLQLAKDCEWTNAGGKGVVIWRHLLASGGGSSKWRRSLNIYANNLLKRRLAPYSHLSCHLALATCHLLLATCHLLLATCGAKASSPLRALNQTLPPQKLNEYLMCLIRCQWWRINRQTY